MLQVIDPTQYAEAAQLLAEANASTTDIASALFDAIGDASACAGHGDATRAWCTAYTKTAEPVVQQISHLVDALGTTGVLLHASGRNHARAETAAAAYGLRPEAMTGVQRDFASITTVWLSDVPSMYGGNSDEPWGWGFISSHLFSPWWPGADLTRVRALAAAWHEAAHGLSTASYHPHVAVAVLETLNSPELSDAIDVCRRLSKACELLAADCYKLGTACATFAHDVEEKRGKINHLVKEFCGAAGFTEVIALGAGIVSGGLSEVASKAVDGTLAGVYAARISDVLDTLSHTLQASGLTLAIADASHGFNTWLAAVADAKPVLAAIDDGEAVLTAELGVTQTGGVLGSSAVRYSVTKAQMEHWERTTNSHTERKHCGQTIKQLRDRLAAENQRRLVSSFDDLDQATAAINHALKVNEEKINRWLDSSAARIALDDKLPHKTGTILWRDGTQAEGTSTRTVLVKDPLERSGYRVLTAYLNP